MMIEQMAMAVAKNIINDIRNSTDRYAPELSAICIADFGGDAAFFYARPVIPPRAEVKFSKGVWAHYIKSAFEKYFMWKIKSGNIAPFFEEEGLKLLFGVKGVVPCSDCSGVPGSAC